jgi:hypothetical protein
VNRDNAPPNCSLRFPQLFALDALSAKCQRKKMTARFRVVLAAESEVPQMKISPPLICGTAIKKSPNCLINKEITFSGLW